MKYQYHLVCHYYNPKEKSINWAIIREQTITRRKPMTEPMKRIAMMNYFLALFKVPLYWTLSVRHIR